MAPRILAVCWALGSVVAAVAAETGSRQSLTARRATTAQQQAASEPCAIFDALTSPDQDCDYLVSYWGITVEDFIFWNPQVGDNCENISVGEGYCVKSTRTKPPSPPSKFNPDNGIETPSPTQPGMVGNCNKFHLVEDAATCEEIADYNKISLEELFAWNTGLDKDCTNLWRGTHACVGVVGEGTPLPVQPGMVDDCDKFHLVKETTTCQGMADYNDISLAEVLEWNTGLDSTCSNLWLGTYACVGVKGEAKAEAVEGMPSAFPDTTKLDLSQPTPLPAGITPAAAASSVSVLPLTPMMVEVPEGTPEPFI